MDKQSLITKYGKKFVSTTETTPILKGVHYSADGTTYATNRHYGFRIKNAHNFEHALTLDAKTGAPIEGVYPDMSRVFPRDYKDIIQLPAGDVLDGAIGSTRAALAVASEINKRATKAEMIADHGTVRLSVESDILDINYMAFFGNTESIKPSVRSLNAAYLLTALQAFKDADRDVTVWLNGPMEPILLTDGEDIDVLIVPYRTTD